MGSIQIVKLDDLSYQRAGFRLVVFRQQRPKSLKVLAMFVNAPRRLPLSSSPH
jgi:hypothetical protein